MLQRNLERTLKISISTYPIFFATSLQQLKIFVETRWLSILPVAERVLEQLATLRELFKSLNSRKDNKSLKNKPRFKRILCALNKPELPVYLTFTCHGLKAFLCYEKMFHCEQPTIHCLYYEMMECTKCLASRFIKKDVLPKIKHATHFLDLKYADLGHQLDDSKLSLGKSTRELLKHNKDKLSELSLKEIALRHGLSMLKHLRRLNSRKDNKSLKNQPRFKRILCALNKPELPVYLTFIYHGLKAFLRYEKMFHCEQPTIHCFGEQQAGLLQFTLFIPHRF